MSTVRYQNRGIIHEGDDTDMGQEEEESEEEEANEDNIFAPEVSDLEQVVSTFRNELNDCLHREEWNDAGCDENSQFVWKEPNRFSRCKARSLSAIG